MLKIRLVGDPAGATLMNTWEQGIESIWSSKHQVAWANQGLFDVLFDTQFVQSNQHHTVNVHSGNGSANMLNWYTVSNSGWSPAFQDEMAAHEAGHMFGNYDEYAGGAVNPNGTFGNQNDNLMATLSTTQLFNRHFKFVDDWANTHTPVLAPEPSSLLLLVSGLAGLIVQQTRRRTKAPIIGKYSIRGTYRNTQRGDQFGITAWTSEVVSEIDVFGLKR